MTKILELKAKIRARDGQRCTDCGKRQRRLARRLDVHRIIPGSQYSPGGCVTVCRSCHQKKHPQRAQRVAWIIPQILRTQRSLPRVSKVLNFRLSLELIDALEKCADFFDSDPSSLVRQMIVECLPTYLERGKKFQEERRRQLGKK